MSLFDLPRIPEPEVMDDSGEVEAYSSATAQTHLDAVDNTFVEHALRLLKGRERGLALDIGTGPGEIVIKLARHLTRWKFTGVDRSPGMIARAKERRISQLRVADSRAASNSSWRMESACRFRTIVSISCFAIRCCIISPTRKNFFPKSRVSPAPAARFCCAIFAGPAAWRIRCTFDGTAGIIPA
jgi:cyclopropane fatty-acyl-phospholipid synthase-like methyltransferase